MSSESESKGGGLFGISGRTWVFVALVFGCAFAFVVSTMSHRFADQVVLSRAEYDKLLLSANNLGSPSFRGHISDASAAAASSNIGSCDIAQIHLGFDSRFGPKSTELRAKLDNKPYPSYETLYELVVNKPYSPAMNIFQTFPNSYGLVPNFQFPFSNLRESHIEKALTMLDRPPKFTVEVGSFHGHSAILQAQVLDKHKYFDVPLLCIDPWTGDLGMLLFRDDWDKKLTPGELADGRSTSYWQFMLNVQDSMKRGKIGPKHIIPLASTSIVGARFLMALGLTPDLIYLDSAHEIDETFTELTLFYHTLAKGGIVFGDDFSWESVSKDVTRFANTKGLQVVQDGITWMLQKPRY